MTLKKFNTNRVLWWRIILEKYGLDIKYIPVEKNISADALYQLPNNGNQYYTLESAYNMEIMLEIYNTKEIPDGTFPLSFNIIDRYQWEDHIRMEKLSCTEYQMGSL